MTTGKLTPVRPDELHTGGGPPPPPPTARETRLRALDQKWNQFAAEYKSARDRNDQETMTNLRGLMILIKKEIVKLGGTPPEFPSHGEHHLADL
ncbi:MAG: hypothetical protein HY332_25890 [Chloroflexi bacterium]|nr:hypothetical protein [Chloroflexota bacterium]